MERRSKSYIIPLKPTPLKRARLGCGRFYDSQVAEKTTWGLYMLKCHGSAPMFIKPSQLEVIFFMPVALKNTKKIGTYHANTPDLDNLVKFLLDAIVDTKTIITDDRIISAISAKKMYSNNPRTEFTIRELE